MSPFGPLDVVSRDLTSNGDNSSPDQVLAHLKAVRMGIHEMCGSSHLPQSYAPLWHNSTIRIGKDNFIFGKNGL